MRKHPILVANAIAAALVMFALVQYDSNRNEQVAASQTTTVGTSDFPKAKAEVERAQAALDRTTATPMPAIRQINQ